MGFPAVGQTVKLEGGEMEFLVSQVDMSNGTVELTPLQPGFGVAKNIPFADILDAGTGKAFIEASTGDPAAESSS